MASVDTIVAHLRQAVHHLGSAAVDARAAREAAQEIRDRCAALGAHTLVQALDVVLDTIERLEAMLRANIDHGEQLIAQAEAIRHGTATAAGTPAAAPDTATSPWSPPSAVPILAGEHGLSRVLDALPHRPNDEGPTSGYLFRPNGRPVAGGALRSYRDPDLLADLDLPERTRKAEALLSHAEPKAAAMMRRGQAPQHAVLVINNADGPCGWLRGQQGKRRFGTSCDELLNDILPANSTLTVRWRDRAGVERSQVYRGIGRRIRR
jgi:hypothetical protein